MSNPVDLQDEAWSILRRHFEDVERLEPSGDEPLKDIDAYTRSVADAGAVREFVERLTQRLRTLAVLEEWRSRYERPLGALYDDWHGAYSFLEHAIELLGDAVEARDAVAATVLFHVVADAWNDLGSHVEAQPDWEDVYQTLEVLAIQDTTLVATLPAPTIHIPQLIISAQSRLIEAIGRYPAAVYSITPREFEEIVAEIFLRKGFEVTLTQATRDGGRDIIALHETMGIRSKLLIECKRYAPERKVGLAVVQRLYGVKVAEGATKALVATTSSFSKDARTFAQQRVWELDLKGYDDVMGWIRNHGGRGG